MVSTFLASTVRWYRRRWLWCIQVISQSAADNGWRSVPVFGCLILAGLSFQFGCRNHQYAHLLRGNQEDLVGSHEAGAETFNSLVDESVAKLLARQQPAGAVTETGASLGKRICFVGVENVSSEDIGDFKDQLHEQVDTAITSSGRFQTISARFVENGLKQMRLMPDDLMVPANRRQFANLMEQDGQPFDYLLFARLTSGTTTNNKSYQRDYLLTLELVDLQSGQYDKESAKVRKGYHASRLGKWTKYNPLTR